MAAPHARTTPASLPPNQGVELDPLRNPERRRRAALASARDIALGEHITSHVLVAVGDVIASHIADARRDHDGPLPRVNSEEWLAAADSVKLATLLTIGVAYLVADPHQVVRRALKQVALDVHAADPELWRRAHTSHEEMMRRRDWNARAEQQGRAQRDDVA